MDWLIVVLKGLYLHGQFGYHRLLVIYNLYIFRLDLIIESVRNSVNFQLKSRYLVILIQSNQFILLQFFFKPIDLVLPVRNFRLIIDELVFIFIDNILSINNGWFKFVDLFLILLVLDELSLESGNGLWF